MKISLIHDWLRVNAGSEKVVKELLSLYKEDLIECYTLFNTLSIQDKKDILGETKCHTSWLQWMPGIDKLYKNLLPLLPIVISQMKIPPSDLYLSSSHAVAKGAKLSNRDKSSLHICYCHTPMRYAWFLFEDYLLQLSGFKRFMLERLIPFIKKWDMKSAKNVDYFIANSKHIQNQIKMIYSRESTVIYPPVQTDKFKLNPNPRQDFYLALGRFVPYKRLDVIINAFKKMPDKKLVLIGDGYNAKAMRDLLDKCPHIIWLGYQHDDELLLYMQNAKACIFAAKEDFGIMCVEVQSTGTPVLALNYGGYRETVIEGQTGYFFEKQHEESIIEVVQQFERNPIQDHAAIHKHALQFSDVRFRSEIQAFIQAKLDAR